MTGKGRPVTEMKQEQLQKQKRRGARRRARETSGGGPDRQARQIGILVAPPYRQSAGVGFFEQFELLLLDCNLTLARHGSTACFQRIVDRGRSRAKARQIEGRVVFFVSHVPLCGPASGSQSLSKNKSPADSVGLRSNGVGEGLASCRFENVRQECITWASENESALMSWSAAAWLN